MQRPLRFLSIVRVGLPAGFQGIVFSLSNVVIQSSINSFGDTVMAGSLRGLGWSVVPMAVSVVGACGLRLVWIATVFQVVRTPQCLYFSYPVTWIITAACHIICFLVLRRRIRARHDAATAAPAA